MVDKNELADRIEKQFCHTSVHMKRVHIEFNAEEVQVILDALRAIPWPLEPYEYKPSDFGVAGVEDDLPLTINPDKRRE